MSEYYGWYITTAGFDLIEELTAGEASLNITAVKVGDGEISEASTPSEQTDLAGTTHDANIKSMGTASNGIQFTIEFTNEDLTEDFTIRELGIWAQNAAGESILMYYGTLGDYPETVPAYDSTSYLTTRRWAIVMDFDYEGDINIAYSSDLVMTEEDVAALIEEHDSDKSAHSYILGLIDNLNESSSEQKTDISELEKTVSQLNDDAIKEIKVNGNTLDAESNSVDILIETGSEDGTISVDGTDVSVAGLGEVAYLDELISEGDPSTVKLSNGYARFYVDDIPTADMYAAHWDEDDYGINIKLRGDKGADFLRIGYNDGTTWSASYIANFGLNPNDIEQRNIFFSTSYFSGAVALADELTVAGAASLESTLAVAGKTTLTGSLTASANIYAQHDIILSNSYSLRGYTADNSSSILLAQISDSDSLIYGNESYTAYYYGSLIYLGSSDSELYIQAETTDMDGTLSVAGNISTDGNIYLPNSGEIRAYQNGATSYARLAYLSESNVEHFGAVSFETNILGNPISIGNGQYDITVSGTSITMKGDTAITGAVETSSTLETGGTITAGDAVYSGGRIYLPNNKAIRGYTADGSSSLAIGYVNENNEVIIGASGYNTIINGSDVSISGNMDIDDISCSNVELTSASKYYVDDVYTADIYAANWDEDDYGLNLKLHGNNGANFLRIGCYDSSSWSNAYIANFGLNPNDIEQRNIFYSTSYFSDAVTVDGRIYLNGRLYLQNNIAVRGYTADGSSSFAIGYVNTDNEVVIGASGTGTVINGSTISISADTTVNGNLGVAGKLTVEDAMTINGKSAFNSDVAVYSDLNVNGTISAQDTISTEANLFVGTDIEITATLTVGKDAEIAGKLSIGNGLTLAYENQVAFEYENNDSIETVVAMTNDADTLYIGSDEKNTVILGTNITISTDTAVLGAEEFDVVNADGDSIGTIGYLSGLGTSGTTTNGVGFSYNAQDSDTHSYENYLIVTESGVRGQADIYEFSLSYDGSFTTTATTVNLGANGATVYLGGSTYSSSDLRLKQDINPLDSTALLDRLKPVTYRWKKNPGKLHAGFIAQDIANTLTDLGMDDMITGTDNEGYYTVDYNALIPVLVNGYQKLERRVKELEEKL